MYNFIRYRVSQKNCSHFSILGPISRVESHGVRNGCNSDRLYPWGILIGQRWNFSDHTPLGEMRAHNLWDPFFIEFYFLKIYFFFLEKWILYPCRPFLSAYFPPSNFFFGHQKGIKFGKKRQKNVSRQGAKSVYTKHCALRLISNDSYGNKLSNGTGRFQKYGLWESK